MTLSPLTDMELYLSLSKISNNLSLNFWINKFLQDYCSTYFQFTFYCI